MPPYGQRTGKPCQLRRPGCQKLAIPGWRCCNRCKVSLLREMQETGYLEERAPTHTNYRRHEAREDRRETRDGPMDSTEIY